MTTLMEGQGDLLELLQSAPTEYKTPAAPAPATHNSMSRWCEACGEIEFMQTIHDRDSALHGHPVCLGMNLTLSHVHYYLKRAGGGWPEEDPTPCCYDKSGIHGKKISKPTRAHYLDHAQFDIARAAHKWKRHLPSLIKAIGALREKHGITPDEAPVIQESEQP